jgi:hypothetical protein
MLLGMDIEKALRAFLADYPHAMAFGAEEPAQIVERNFAPGFTFRNDGLLLERADLVAHARPARKNVTDLQVEIQEVVVQYRRFAARYVLRAQMRGGATVANIVYGFGEMDADFRVVKVVQATKELPAGGRPAA